ncbi:LCP family protein [Streptomyces sp. BI20]|uniref:LCP family protein n=1 Tax=Streptomyces sp. BI20 TaxID=3403460 RepID=UPI003C74D5E5
MTENRDTPHIPAAGPSGAGGSGRRRRRVLRWVGLGLVLLVLLGAGVGWWLWSRLDGNITEDTSAAAELRRFESSRPSEAARGVQNILLIGSDTRAGEGNAEYGQDVGTQRSDTTILLHLPADRRTATAVSIPRDLMVEIPECTGVDGGTTRRQFAQFNWSFEFGGAGCTIRTVEELTGIRVDHHMVVDFRGFTRIVNAVGGVEVCLARAVVDEQAKLDLPAGRQTLNGEQALAFVRARHALGDGSDTERMTRQQEFLGSLVKKVQSNGVLLNPARLYPLLDAATSSLTTDPGLASLRDLYEFVRGVRSIPTGEIRFTTVPRMSYPGNPNRDALREPDASRLFELLREDRPVPIAPAESEGGSGAGTGSPMARGMDAEGLAEWWNSVSGADSRGFGKGNVKAWPVGSEELVNIVKGLAEPHSGKVASGARENGHGFFGNFPGMPRSVNPSESPSPEPPFTGTVAGTVECR